MQGQVYTYYKKLLRYFYIDRIYQRLRDIRIKRKWMKVLDVKSWALQERMSVKDIDSDEYAFIAKPNMLENMKILSSFAYGKAKLPKVYCAELSNVCAVGDTELLIAKNNIALYDEIAFDKEGNFGLRRGTTPLIKKRHVETEKILLEFKKSKQKLPEQAIHFCKDYSYNYFHWLIECLPRMWIIENGPQYGSLPLLVDRGLQRQQFESLKLITEREIILLDPGKGYVIKTLIYPSPLSSVHEILPRPNTPRYDRDILIAPKAIEYLRNKYLPLLEKQGDHRHRPDHYHKIFISRKHLANTKQRLANTIAIEEKLASMGFSIIHPESLSFLEQVRLFANAKIIVGGAGSAFANMVFVQKTCKVFLLCIPSVNPYLFGSIASIVGCELYHVIDHTNNHLSNPHNLSDAHGSFAIDPAYLAEVLSRQ